MAFPARVTRADEKLGVILEQVRLLRRRLNSLALQHSLYLALASAIVGATLIFAAANWLSPIAFIATAAATSVTTLFCLWRAVRSGWQMRSNAIRAAALADDRAELKGRLATIAEVAPSARRGALWSYLVEDALGHREEFTPARIEKKLVSRSLWLLVASAAVAVAIIPLARVHPRAISVANDKQEDITIDLQDLHLRSADSGDSGGLVVQADPATMRRLREKLAREGVTPEPGPGGALNGLLDRARNLADTMQNKLRGQTTHKQRLNLRLADNDPGFASNNQNSKDANAWRSPHRGDESGQFKHEEEQNDQDAPLPPIEKSPRNPAQQPTPSTLGGGGGGEPGGGGDIQSQASSNDSGEEAESLRGEGASNSGFSHGIGADPDSLFGEPVNSRMGNEGFEIAIEARPIEQGAKGAGQAYLPPKVRTPLNSNQQSDEPIARTAVPPDDRTTIQRVFER